ncbi:hypothetical protein Ancab_001287, partial [Ancistrocladus abbreviatus]
MSTEEGAIPASTPSREEMWGGTKTRQKKKDTARHPSKLQEKMATLEVKVARLELAVGDIKENLHNLVDEVEEQQKDLHREEGLKGRIGVEIARSSRPRCCHCYSRITCLAPTQAKKEKVGKKLGPKSSSGDKPHFKGNQSKGDKSKAKEKAPATDAKEQSKGCTP